LDLVSGNHRPARPDHGHDQADDGRGGIATATFTYAVESVAPTIAISGADSVNEGASYTLTLGAVTDPRGGHPLGDALEGEQEKSSGDSPFLGKSW
jgi:hypothetical protein